MPDTILSEKSDKILTITLNRPEKLNALTPTLLAELKDELATVAKKAALAERKRLFG